MANVCAKTPLLDTSYSGVFIKLTFLWSPVFEICPHRPRFLPAHHHHLSLSKLAHLSTTSAQTLHHGFLTTLSKDLPLLRARPQVDHGRLPPHLPHHSATAYTFTQTHTTSTIRLLLGYGAVLISAALFVYDYKTSWAASKPYTLPACVAYFVLNGALTGWIFFVERGLVFQGVRVGGRQELTVRSRGRKHSDEYRLDVTYAAAGGSGKKWEEKSFTGSFTRWFSKEGYLQKKELIVWLAENVEVLGLAEKERRSKETKSSEERAAVEVSNADIFDASRGLPIDVRRADGDMITVETSTSTPGAGKKSKSGRKKA